MSGGRALRPGQCAYHAAKHCECCAPTPAAAPFGPRKTMGTCGVRIVGGEGRAVGGEMRPSATPLRGSP